MTGFKKAVFIFLFVGSFCLNVKAQQPVVLTDAERAQNRQEQQNRQDAQDEFNRRMKDLDNQINGGATAPARRRRRRDSSAPLSKADRARISAILAPAAEDAAKYANFLRGKNTGLFRLFPDFDCAKKIVIRVDGDCANLVPGSWNYSFRQKNYSDFFDLKLKGGNLISEGFLSQGILVRLGDAPLDALSTASAGVRFLADFAPQTESAAAKKQLARLASGVDADGYKYATRARAEAGATYALRVVAYRVQNKAAFNSRQSGAPELKFAFLNDVDKREDLIVVFRVVRLDEKGGATILWKVLSKRAAPKIIFAKGEKMSDIKAGK